METKTKQYLFELDNLRAIAALAVVAIHVSSFAVELLEQESFLFILLYALNRLIQFAVPLFLILSALLEAYQYSQKAKIDWPSFYHKKAKRLLFPYLFWSIIYLLFYTFVYRAYHISLFWDIKQLFYFFGLGKSSYHLYFMVILMQALLFLPLLTLFSPWGKKHPLRFIFLFYLLQIVLAKLIEKTVYPIFPDIVNSYLWYFFPFNSALVIGLNYHKIKKISSVIWVGIGGLTFLSAAFYLSQSFFFLKGVDFFNWLYLPNWYIYTFGLSFLLIGLAPILEKRLRLKSLLKPIGQYSYGIYFVHPIFLTLISSLIRKMGNFSPFLFILLILSVFLLVLFLSYLSSKILSKLPFTKFLMGINQ